jgi:hypothetical protein
VTGPYATLTRRSFVQAAAGLAFLPATRGHAAEEISRMATTPAESEPHAKTWMAWPSTPAIYVGPGAYLESVQETLGQLAAAIAENEPVAMAAPADQHDLAARLCGPHVELVNIPTDDMWARDSGPVFVRKKMEASPLSTSASMDGATSRPMLATANLPAASRNMLALNASIRASAAKAAASNMMATARCCSPKAAGANAV